MKILKKILKITGIVIASIILLMILMVIGAKIFENELASFTMDQLETEIDAPMSIGKVSLIPLFSFPRVSAEINDLWIGEPESFENDTLFFINSLKVGLDAWDLISGTYNIEKVEISDLDFDYIIYRNGISNIDFLIDAFTDTTTVDNANPFPAYDSQVSTVDFSAEKLRLENIRVHYYDSLTNTASQVFIPAINMKAKAKNDVYTLKTDGSFVLSKLLFEGTKIHLMESCDVSFDLTYANKEATIYQLNLLSEGIEMGIEGAVKLRDTVKINAKLQAEALDFDILKKYVPDEYAGLIEGAELGRMEPVAVTVDMDYSGNAASIENLSFNAEAIDLVLNGNFDLGDTLTIDAGLNAKKLDLDKLKQFIPKQYKAEYDIIDVGGDVGISAEINGRYADSTLLPVVNADLSLKNFRLQTRDYPKIDTLNLAAEITTDENPNMSNAVINITDLMVKTPLSSLQVDGIVRGMKTPVYNINTKLDLSLAELESQIPDSLARNLQGRVIAGIKTSGTLPEQIPDDFADYILDRTSLSANLNNISGLLMDSLQLDNFSTDITFALHNSRDKKIQIKNLDLAMEAFNINLQSSSMEAILSGRLAELSTLGVELQSFRFQNGRNLATGSAEVRNPEYPEFEINTNVFLDLEELSKFTPDSMLKSMTGTVKAGIRSQGKIHPDSIDTQLFPIVFENSSFDVDFDNICLAFPDSIMDVDNLSGRMRLENDFLNIDDFSASYNGLALEMDSSIVHNIYKAVLLNNQEELYVKTHVNIGDIKYDDFKHLMAIEAPDDTSNTSEAQNWTFLVHGSAEISSFIMDSTTLEGYNINRLHVDDISTLFKFEDSTYIIDQFKFKAFEGEMNNSFHYKIREDGTYSLSSRNIIQQMNIRTLLRDMDNFGMDSLIQYQHISGLLSTDLNTFVPIDDSVLIDKILISGDVVLEKGGVYNYPPAQEISSLPGLKDLDDLQFKTLRSNVFMFKNKLYVPRTLIVSNALDIAAFGMQNMNYDCEYHLEVHLSNILFGKSKKRNKKQDASGDEVDEESLKKASHKVRYSVVEGESKVKRDTKESREAMTNKIRTQQKMLDFIFFPKNIHYSTDVDKKY